MAYAAKEREALGLLIEFRVPQSTPSLGHELPTWSVHSTPASRALTLSATAVRCYTHQLASIGVPGRRLVSRRARARSADAKAVRSLTRGLQLLADETDRNWTSCSR
jgi:hypothetical protein